MKHTRIQIPVLLLLWLLNACTGNTGKNEPAVIDSNKTTSQQPAVAVLYTWDQLEKIDQKEIDNDRMAGQESKQIVIAGYLSLPSSIYTIGKSIRCDLYPRYNQAKGMHANLEFEAGTNNNQMQAVPEKYSLLDFKIKTDSGQAAGEGSYVKVTGTLSFKQDDYVTLNVVKIEKSKSQPFDYSTVSELNTDNVDALNNKLVYVNGIIEAGYFLGLFTSFYYSLDVKQSKLPDSLALKANVRIGTGMSQIEELPDHFTNKDIRIHNQNGKIIPVGKKVKILGVFKKSDSGNGGDIYVEQIIG